MLKFLVHLLSCFIPHRPWRKQFRQKCNARFGWNIAKYQKHFNRIAAWQRIEIDGIAIDSGVLPNGKSLCLVVSEEDTTRNFCAYEIFTKNGYHFTANANTEAVVIDIGMNAGIAALYFAMRDDVVAVYGYEPVPQTYATALINFKHNSYAKKITPHNFALGNADKCANILYKPKHSGGSTMIFDNKPMPESEKINIRVRAARPTIDKIVRHHPQQQIVLKCDAEGAELEIFKHLVGTGGFAGIHQIVMEYHYGYGDQIERLLKSNYRTVQRTGEMRGILRARDLLK